jgi:hypothetical protein
MSDKTEQELQQEQQGLADQAEKDFAAGFTGDEGARDVLAPAGSTAIDGDARLIETQRFPLEDRFPQAGDDGQQQGGEAAAGAGADDIDNEPTIAGLKESEVRALLARIPDLEALRADLGKTRDTMAGKYGELNRTIQTLQQGGGGGGKLTVSKEQLKRVAEHYSDDFADALAQDLSEINAGASAGAQPAQLTDEQLDALLNPRFEQFQHDLEKKYLLRQHGDFYEQLKTPEFKLWFDALKPEEQTEFNASGDSIYLGDRMTAFKTWRGNLSKQQQQQQDRQQRLEEAVQTRGAAAATGVLSADQELEAGFRSVRGK